MLRTTLILAFNIFIAFRPNEKTSNISDIKTAQPSTVSQKGKTDNALAFINSYVENSSKNGPGVEIREWVKSNGLSTRAFKAELDRILDEAYKEEPEVGLDFDPILDAQDSPSGFELESFNEMTNYLIVKGRDWPEFKVTMKIKEENGNWLVDGCGIINIPGDKRANR